MFFVVKNKKDIDDIPDDVKKDLSFHFVKRVEEVLDLALESNIDEGFIKEEATPIFNKMRPKL